MSESIAARLLAAWHADGRVAAHTRFWHLTDFVPKLEPPQRALIEGALLTGDPLALASALRTIDSRAASLPLRWRGPLAAASHLMIACPFPPRGLGRVLRSHPPTGERVRRLESLAGVAGSGPR